MRRWDTGRGRRAHPRRPPRRHGQAALTRRRSQALRGHGDGRRVRQSFGRASRDLGRGVRAARHGHLGREVGARVSFYNVTVTELTGNPASYYTVDSAAELGEFFAFCPQATRNGEGFGACQSFRHFRTVAERDAAVAKYFKDAEKRATKAAART